jgi:exodeoxyribonuclease VII large subunit
MLGPDSAPDTNATEISVSELSQALKRTVEDRFGYVRVRGEISGFRGVHSSGHAYFALKDEGAKLDAVIWRGSYARLKVKPEEGMEVVATGKLTTYPGKSSYQIVIERLELAGLGALMQAIEERKKRLAAEGLFEPSRKKPLPHLPEVIGVVTSPTGAVIRDILHRLSERFPRRVILWPVAVQGDKAAAEIAAAIRGFNALEPGGAIPRPDVLIVGRGGGSFEDLLAFQEEIVVRAAAASAIPLISAVGHETDTTLIDFAADRRAPTPTAAAEMAVPVRADLLARTLDAAQRLVRAAARGSIERGRRLRDLARALPRPDDILALARQRLDALATRLPAARSLTAERARNALARAAARLQPRLLAAEARRLSERVTATASRLAPSLARRLSDHKQTLLREGRLLETLSHRATLARGFALVRGADGTLRRTAGAIQSGERLTLAFSDGETAATADGEAPPKPKAPRPTGPQGQGTLF